MHRYTYTYTYRHTFVLQDLKVYGQLNAVSKRNKSKKYIYWKFQIGKRKFFQNFTVLLIYYPSIR